jgi:DedD protein
MPTREPELYKDKIEVSLDGRQIFYLFFGGAVIVGLVFVIGVMVGRRVESRGHLDRADTQTTRDPLAALDRLERADHLSFRGALTGSEATSDVEKAIGERRAAARREPEARTDKPKADKPEDRAVARADKPEAKPEAKPDAKPDRVDHGDKPELKPDRPDKPDRGDAKPDADKPKPERADKHDAKPEPITRPDADKPKPERADKHDGERKPKKHDDADAKPDKEKDKPDKPITKPDARAEGRSDEAKPRYTLQLSSFQDKTEADAFLSAMRSAGFQPYLTEADVDGKGTFYRVRLGSFRSLDAANDAKAEYEKAAKKPAQAKSAQVMRL